MRVFVELKSGKVIETSLYIEKLQESLMQLMGVLEAFHQVKLSEIKSIKYNPARNNFKPYSIKGFDSEIDFELILSAKASHKLRSMDSE